MNARVFLFPVLEVWSPGPARMKTGSLASCFLSARSRTWISCSRRSLSVKKIFEQHPMQWYFLPCGGEKENIGSVIRFSSSDSAAARLGEDIFRNFKNQIYKKQIVKKADCQKADMCV